MKKNLLLTLCILSACTYQSLNTDHSNIEEQVGVETSNTSSLIEENNTYSESLLQPDYIENESNEQKNNTPGTDKPSEKKDEVTYGSVRYEDTTIHFKTLPSVNDISKEQGSSGYISKGTNGLNRKEIRDVYVNGKFSYTETVKETYIVSNAIDEQKWIGTKEPSQVEEELEEINYIFFKTYDSFDTCNYQANELARINSKKGWLSTMCDGPNLYYTLRD